MEPTGYNALTAVVTKAVVATCVVFVPAEAVGAVGVPVKAGEAKGARAVLMSDWVAVTGPVIFGKVALMVDLINRRWSSAVEMASEAAGS